MRSVPLHSRRGQFVLVLLLLLLTSVAAALASATPSSAVSVGQSEQARKKILDTIQSDIEWLMSEQNQDVRDHSGYGSFWREWYAGGRSWDGKYLDEVRIQEMSYLLAWAWKNVPTYKNDKKVLDAALAGLDHYARSQYRGNDPARDRLGRIGALYPGFAWPQLRAYELLASTDLGYVTEWYAEFDGTANDYDLNRDVYLAPADRWRAETRAGVPVQVALPNTVNYFGIRTLAPQSRRTNNVIDRDADLFSDFDIVLKVDYYDDFVGYAEFYVHGPGGIEVLDEIKGRGKKRWESKLIAVPARDLYQGDRNQFIFSIRFAQGPVPIRSISGLIDRRAYYMRTWELLARYILYGGDSSEGGTNQDVAEALTAFHLARILDSAEMRFYYERKLAYLAGVQRSGVFLEGGGYDTGYQMVSSTTLAILYRETGDPRVGDMLRKALFISYDSYLPSEKGFVAAISSRIPRSVQKAVDASFNDVHNDVVPFIFPFIVAGALDSRYHGVPNDLISNMGTYNLAGTGIYEQVSQDVQSLPYLYESLERYSSDVKFDASDRISLYGQLPVTIVRSRNDVVIMDYTKGFAFYPAERASVQLPYSAY